MQANVESKTYWHAYYDPETIERSDRLRQEFQIETSNVQLHIDAYLQPDPNAPTILLTHGEGGYARMFVRPALELYDRQYSVLVFDQRGHGYSSGKGQDFTLPELVQDVLDAAHWARRNFTGPLFLGGVNGGGALVYMASALGAPVLGLIMHTLYDFGSPEDALAISRFSGLAELPGGAQIAPGLAAAAAKVLMAFSPRMHLPYDSLQIRQPLTSNGRQPPIRLCIQK